MHGHSAMIRQTITTRESVREIFNQSASEVKAYVESLSEEDLQHTPNNMPFNVWKTLLHLTNHGTDHRAQVLRSLDDFGAPTFDQDLFFYLVGQ